MVSLICEKCKHKQQIRSNNPIWSCLMANKLNIPLDYFEIKEIRDVLYEYSENLFRKQFKKEKALKYKALLWELQQKAIYDNLYLELEKTV